MDSETSSRLNADSEFHIGDTVKVKLGVRDPDIAYANAHGEWWDDVQLGGWVGVVTRIDEDDDGTDLLTIEWDSHTLRRVPSRWLNFCLDHGSTDRDSFGYMVLAADEVEPTEPRDTEDDREKGRNRIESIFEWDDRLEDICALVGLNKEDEDDGEIIWTVMELNKDGDATEIGAEQRGLTLLKHAFEAHTLELLSGDYRVNGKRSGARNATVEGIAMLSAMGTPALLVRAHWEDFDINGKDVEFQHDIVVGLLPRS